MSHNKTLAGAYQCGIQKLLSEFYVEFFISYYYYYQPEAYVPTTDTYIFKKDSFGERRNPPSPAAGNERVVPGAPNRDRGLIPRQLHSHRRTG